MVLKFVFCIKTDKYLFFYFVYYKGFYIHLLNKFLKLINFGSKGLVPVLVYSKSVFRFGCPDSIIFK